MDSGIYFVRFFTDDWLGYVIVERQNIPYEFWSSFTQKIAHFCDEGRWVLDPHFAEKFPDICSDIVATKISRDAQDELIWPEHKNGIITAKHAYGFCRNKFLRSTGVFGFG